MSNILLVTHKLKGILGYTLLGQHLALRSILLSAQQLHLSLTKAKPKWLVIRHFRIQPAIQVLPTTI
ncbi:hypothetical protein [Mangrovibacterium sp.]|uniref:hypothetical protein n=1 Tax=Mangrovibacterium sp. TaxID=1961364 RepID=UPI003569E392